MIRPVAVTPASVHLTEWAALAARLPRADPASAMSLAPGDTALVVVAHPDDETFGLGATVATLTRAGVDVRVLTMSAGEAALDHVGHRLPGLGARRRAEFARACEALDVTDARIVGLPDGRLGSLHDEVRTVISAAAERVGAKRLLTTWWRDPHADHEAVGQLAVEVAAERGIGVTGFPIWAPHWTDPLTLDLKASTLHVMTTRADAHAARQAATDCYRSQTEPLSPGLQAILPASMVCWTTEIAIGR